MINLQKFQESLFDITNIDDLKQYFSDELKMLGYMAFDAFSFESKTISNLRQDGNFYVASYGLGFLESFIDQGMIENCTVSQKITQSSYPFHYIQSLEQNKSNLSVQFQYRLMKLFNIHHAWLIPMNTISCVKGVTVYTQGRSKKVQQQFLATKYQVQIMAQMFVEGLEAFSPSKIMLEDLTNKAWNKQTLSAREIECLGHCGQGYTYAEIGKLLTVSENTIRFHMKNIFRKLNVSSRSEAVALSFKRQLM